MKHINPSIAARVRLEGKRVDGFEIVVEEIPLRFNENRGAIEGHIARIDPSAVICTGQSGRASISLERGVINVADAKTPYTCGTRPVDEPLHGLISPYDTILPKG